MTFLKTSWKAAAGWRTESQANDTTAEKAATWAQRAPILFGLQAGQQAEVCWQAKQHSNPSKPATENAAPSSLMD